MKILLSFLILATVPFYFAGIIQRVKSIWAGRVGTPVLQPMRDFRKLLLKGEVISSVTSFVFYVGACIYLASVLTAFLIVSPLPCCSLLAFPGDFVVFAYLLGLGRFFLILSAMDTGSSFEGMGASREITFATLVEPAFFILLGSLALFTGYGSFTSIFSHLENSMENVLLLKCVSIPALFIMLLVEGSRVPIDDPNTHLELTMIHEVMVLDHSGPNLAFVLYGTYLKMVLIAQLIAGLIIPDSLPLLIYIGLWMLVLLFCAIAIGIIESFIARSRMTHNPQFIFVMTALALIALASVVYSMHGGV